MKRTLQGLAASLALTLGVATAHAEDIDLFVQPGGAASAPNVLIILDNTANWNSPFDFEKNALIETVDALMVPDNTPARVSIGLMLFTESGGQNKGEDGGYIRAAVRPFSGTYQTAFKNLVSSLDRNEDKSNGGKASKTMADAWAYFAGRAPYTGNRKVKTDYTGNTDGTAQSRAIYALGNNALPSYDGSPYRSPSADGACGGNYIIYISNGPVQDNNNDIKTSTGWLSAAAAELGIANATDKIPLSPSGSMGNIADEWARFMRRSPQQVKVYTLDVYDKVTGQTGGWSALLESMSKQSDGDYYHIGDASAADAASKFEFALKDIFSKIQAVNTVFASVSLPVSVNTEGTYLNQVFVGMFRPSADAMARWDGNLKQYKLGLVGNDLKLLDAADKTAINSNTGFITECARSFWTPSALDAYWSFRPQGECLAIPNSDQSNYPDGRVVEKGGHAYMLRATGHDTAKTDMTTCVTFSACKAGNLSTFNTANAGLENEAFGVATKDERDTLIEWVIGQNNKTAAEEDDELKDTDDDNESGHTLRPSLHGDVVHSRPVAINYAPEESDEPKVVVFYGANDGVLRAINGNRTDPISGIPAGGELWSFMPPQFLPHIKRLRDNTIEFDYEGSTNDQALPKPYGMDGAITTYRSQDGSTMWLYGTMRRGGRALFAFDVSNLTSDDSKPTKPTLKWTIGCPHNFTTNGTVSDDGCSPGASDFGQTWSAATVTNVPGYNKPVILMGGGYDTCEDSDPHACSAGVKGNGVFVIDADTGDILVKLPTDRSVVGDIAVIRNFATGIASMAYAADMGGNVYRITGANSSSIFGDTPPSSWTITKIAALGCDDTLTCDENRKFMFVPDVVEKNGTYYVLLGSGDREKPLHNWPHAYATQNHFFMIRDVPGDPNWLSSESATCKGASVICLDSLLEIEDENPSDAALAAKKGWYLPMRAHEQVVTSAITVYGTTTFSTHTPVVPNSQECGGSLGTSRVYNIRYLNAAPRVGKDRSAVVAGGGLSPSPVAGIVTLDDGRKVPFIIGANPDSPLEGDLPSSPSTGTQPKSLTYWLIEKK